MTLTELRYVVAVATERHFGRAAERCFVSQPSLSAAVKNLEDELGVLIFERGKGEVLVTPIGEEVVAQARRALDEAARVKTVAAQGRNPLEGPLGSASSTRSRPISCRSSWRRCCGRRRGCRSTSRRT